MTNIIEVRAIERRLKALRITDLKDWEGKSILNTVITYDLILIHFATGQWSAVDTTDDSGAETSLMTEFSDYSTFEKLSELGILSVGEWDSIKIYYENIQAEADRKRELVILQRLKAKYEGSCHQ